MCRTCGDCTQEHETKSVDDAIDQVEILGLFAIDTNILK